jgi:hypothetical protein
MSLVPEWRKQLRAMMESPFPQFIEPPIQDTLGGNNLPKSEPIPVINADSEHNHCSIDCEALKEILNWAGADQSEAERVVEKIKTLSNEFGVVTVEHLNDVLSPMEKDQDHMGPKSLDISRVIPNAPNGLMSRKVVNFKENLEKVMNDEEIEVIKKKKE